MDHLQPGDHLIVDISNNTSKQLTRYAGAKHHGIYVGDGDVIHFDADTGTVTTDTLDGFSKDCPIRVKRHASSPHQAITNARERLGRALFPKSGN